MAAPLRPDLVVGSIEVTPQGIYVLYGNQGPGECTAATVSLRVSNLKSGEPKEIFTLDRQPTPRKPLQVCRTQLIPLANLGETVKDNYATMVFDIDPQDVVVETDELNNDHFEDIYFTHGQPDRPDFQRYAGLPDLCLQALEFIPPHEIRATIVNRGKGITLADFTDRWTLNGQRGKLPKFRFLEQPLPLPGQLCYRTLDYEKWDSNLKLGDTVTVKYEIDPTQRVRELNRANNVVEKKLQLGHLPTVQPEPARVAGRLGRKGWSFSVVSAAAVWELQTRTLRLYFFPFELTPEDTARLQYNDSHSVVARRGKALRWAWLEIEFEPGTERVDLKKVERLHWWDYGEKGGGSHSAGDFAVRDWQFSPTLLRAGETLNFQLQDNAAMRGQVSGEVSLIVQPGGAVKDEKERPLPRDVPTQWVRGTVTGNGKTFQAVSVFARKIPEYGLVLMHILPVKIRPEHVAFLQQGSWNEVVEHLDREDLQCISLYWYEKTGWRQPTVDVCTGKAGLGSFELYAGAELKGKPEEGKPVGFRVQAANVRGWKIDLEGSVQIAK